MNQNQTKKDENERYVAERFCVHLGDGCRLLDAEREIPDCLISIHGKEIGLELVRIRRSDAYDHSVDSFRNFYFYAQGRARSDERARGLIDVTTRLEASRKSGKTGKFYPPHESEYKLCYEELISLFINHVPKENGEGLDVYYREDYPEGDRRLAPEERPKARWIDEEDYPKLYVCFKSFSLYGGSEDLSIVNCEFRSIALDEGEVRRVMKSHHEKLDAYRKNLPGHPIWLLLYTEGDATTRKICEKRHIGKIKKIYQDMDAAGEFKGDDRFDEVWLGTNAVLEDLPKHVAEKTISSPKSYHRLA